MLGKNPSEAAAAALVVMECDILRARGPSAEEIAEEERKKEEARKKAEEEQAAAEEAARLDESFDMFQTDHYRGGYGTAEHAFCFRYDDFSGNEF
ncbi:MAG: hypothetical protein ACK5TR_08490 [Alphaproteobacteria bacterium]|jgi:hypothetical protein|nr:hypothetical protein [Alphaproteobacteria bacterium]